jgi:teichuronic acid exporter
VSTQAFFQQIKAKCSSQFIQNLGWLGGAELVIRVVRLITTVILARLLSPYDYGLAAVVLTTNEFVSVFTRNGIWAKLVQADEQDLESLCQTAYWLNWIVCGGLFVIQCIAAFPIAELYHDKQVILPICTMALVYLMIPVSLIKAALIQRENRLRVSALINALQVSSDNVLTILLAVIAFQAHLPGMWAIVLPKVLVAPIWVIGFYINHDWKEPKSFTLKRWREIVSYSQSILGVQLLATFRNNLDYLIAGRFLGIQPLGLYYFAFNAGLGISLSVTNALDSALFPHLCEARQDREQFRKRYFSSLKTIAMIIIPLVLLQASLAPLYVPIIFDQKWIPAIPILVLICLSAIPRPFASAAAQTLWALDKPHWDLIWNCCFTTLFAISLLIGVQWGVVGIAAGVLLAHAIALPIYTIFVTRYFTATVTREG